MTEPNAKLARLHATRLLASCLWAARRTDDAEATLLPVAVECARHGLIRFLVDGGPNVIAALTALREHVAEIQGRRAKADLPDAFIDAVLAATR